MGDPIARELRALVRVLPTWRSGLTPREQRVVELRCGLRAGLPTSQTCVAKRLGLSVSGVAGIERRVRGRLRARVASETPYAMA